MKKLIREGLGLLLIPLDLFKRDSRPYILSIYFHNPSLSLFEKIIKWLIKRRYHFISLQELHQILVTKQIPEQKLAVITFDDGWNGNLKLIASFEKFKVPVTFFITTDAVNNGNFWWEYACIKGQEKFTDLRGKNDFKVLPQHIFAEKVKILKLHYSLPRSCITVDELKTLSRHELVTIGAHTVSHPILDKCSFALQEYELKASKKQLEEWLGKEVKYLAYPNGDYNDDTMIIAKQNAYELAFTIEPEKIDVERADRYQLPRYAINDEGGYFENIAKILGVWQKIFKK